MTADVDLLHETLAERYIGLSELGTGGMSRVWGALDLVTGQQVALVFILDEKNQEKFDRALTAMHREAQLLAVLDANPNVPKLLVDYLEHNPPFLVIEYIRGNVLESLVGRPWNIGSALDVILRAGKVLQEIHEVGIVQRDIKPRNMIRRPDGSVVIIDFDIARLVSEGVAKPSLIRLPRQTSVRTIDTDSTIDSTGTFRYAPIEQVQDHVIDVRCDLYSLSLVAYELLCGRLHKDHTAERYLPSPTEYGIQPGLAKVIMQALSPIEDRPHSVAAWTQQLARFA